MKKTIKFEVELDENNLPIRIIMKSSDEVVNEQDLKALMISSWDARKRETLRIDLWTKDMLVNDMYILYHQTMMSMANSLEKSTSHNKQADALRDYCSFFAEQTKIINTKKKE